MICWLYKSENKSFNLAGRGGDATCEQLENKKSDKQTCVAEDLGIVHVEAHVTNAALQQLLPTIVVCGAVAELWIEVQNSQFWQKQCGADDRSVEVGHLDNFWTGLECSDREDSVSPRNLRRDRQKPSYLPFLLQLKLSPSIRFFLLQLFFAWFFDKLTAWSVHVNHQSNNELTFTLKPQKSSTLFLVDRNDQSLKTEPNLQFLMSRELHLQKNNPSSCRHPASWFPPPSWAGIKKKQVSHFTAKPGEQQRALLPPTFSRRHLPTRLALNAEGWVAS